MLDNSPYELHAHTFFSDGTDSPEEIVQQARALGLKFVAVSDHDTLEGVPRALAEGAKIGMPVLPALEFDARFSSTLHILGAGVDIHDPALTASLVQARQARTARRDKILAALEQLGIFLRQDSNPAPLPTRMHIALALVRQGHAAGIGDAFARYLADGQPAHVPINHLPPEEIIGLIHGAGGLAIVAHPMKIKADVPALLHRLKAAGLDGVEAYYPGTPPKLRAQYLSLARELRLMATCGSDYHGLHRPGVVLGCAFEPVPALRESRERLFSLIKEVPSALL